MNTSTVVAHVREYRTLTALLGLQAEWFSSSIPRRYTTAANSTNFNKATRVQHSMGKRHGLIHSENHSTDPTYDGSSKY
jgi:hypothetical protein